MISRTVLTLIALVNTSSMFALVSKPFRLVERDGNYIVQHKSPVLDTLSTPTPVYNLEEVPAQKINTARNQRNIRPGNSCAYAQITENGTTSDVIVCLGGEAFKDVTKMRDMEISRPDEYKNYIGSYAERPGLKFLFCDGPCQINQEIA